MYDFAKTEIKSILPNDLLNHTSLNFLTPINRITGDFIDEQSADYNGLKFIIKNDRYIKLNGSFHKHMNNGDHNHNDFTINDFVEVLISLSAKFNINPFLDILHNLEFGVNILCPFNVQMFLNAIISYKGKEYNKEKYNGKGCLLRFEFDQYELKIYDKGFQYGLDENILRIEIKVKKMEYFNSKSRSIGIHNYADLLNPDKIKTLSTHLLNAIKELLIDDETINVDKIESRLDRELLLNGRNPKYWTGFKTRSKTYYRQLKRFRKIVLKYGTNNLQNKTLELTKEKLIAITMINAELQIKINNYLSEQESKNVHVLTNKLKVVDSNKMCQF